MIVSFTIDFYSLTIDLLSKSKYFSFEVQNIHSCTIYSLSMSEIKEVTVYFEFVNKVCCLVYNAQTPNFINDSSFNYL